MTQHNDIPATIELTRLTLTCETQDAEWEWKDEDQAWEDATPTLDPLPLDLPTLPLRCPVCGHHADTLVSHDGEAPGICLTCEDQRLDGNLAYFLGYAVFHTGYFIYAAVRAFVRELAQDLCLLPRR